MTCQELSARSREIDDLIKAMIISDQEDTFPILDGIIDCERYLAAKYKILWILKEPYDDFDEEGNPFGGGWDLRGLINSKNAIHEFNGGKPTFKPMIYTAWGILNDFCLWNDMDNVEDDPSMLHALKSIAYINVKKLPGRTHTHFPVCIEAYSSYKSILLKQIETINPHIIIGGGTLPLFLDDLGLSGTDKSIQGSCSNFLKENRIYIDAYHPAQRVIPQQQYCDDIILSVKHWATVKQDQQLS